MKFHLHKTILIFFCITFIKLGFSQTTESKIDQLLNEKFKPNEPGSAIIITQKGEIIYRKAFGMANIELDVKMTPESIFEIGSMTKQFTAISILMLVEQGSIGLNDEITKFIPDYPTNGQKITIHHLLNHTSGIKNYTSIKKLFSIKRNDLKPKELIDLFKNEPMDFNPGEKYKYNNSGYVILGYIIEKVSGMSYENFLKINIFDKVDMVNTMYANHLKVIKKRAYGYQKRDSYQNAMYISFTLPYAAGSIMSTVDDMSKWHLALISYKLVKKETLKKAFTNYKLNNGESTNYGYGWHIKESDNITSIEHGGSIFGFKSMGVYLPSQEINVIMFTNCDCNSPTIITRKIARLVLENSK